MRMEYTQAQQRVSTKGTKIFHLCFSVLSVLLSLYEKRFVSEQRSRQIHLTQLLVQCFAV